MQRLQIAEALVEGASALPIDEMVYRGVNVWPFVRTELAFRLHGGATAALSARLSLRSRVNKRLRAVSERVELHRAPASRTVLLTPANRVVRLQRGSYHALAHPLHDAMQSLGEGLRVWTLGPGRLHAPFASSVDRALSVAMAGSGARFTVTPEPSWYEQFRRWAAERLGQASEWRATAGKLDRMLRAASFFEGTLRRARARALMVDCWYGGRQIGAIVAARRLGLTVVDVQHGLQGAGHFGYVGALSGHSLAPEPDRFWVWGSGDRSLLLASNPALDPGCVDVVGNLWLNEFRAEQGSMRREVAAARAALSASQVGLVPSGSVVLVTLQKGIEYRSWLLPLLSLLPRETTVLVRLHRQMAEVPSELEQELRLLASNVSVVAASELPLYALFGIATWHVTGFSTCAIEALAFGVSSLLTHPSGEEAFAEYLQAGVMQRASSAREIAGRLSESPPTAENCRLVAERAFSRAGVRREMLEGLWS